MVDKIIIYIELIESNINIDNKISILIKPLEQFKQNRKIPISEKLKETEIGNIF